MSMILSAALFVCGTFAVGLGIVHFFMPRLLDFEQAIPIAGSEIRPFRLGPIFHPTSRSDVHGLAWVMNHAASYTIVTVGVLDLAHRWWLETAAGRLVAVWIAGFWLLRAAGQRYVGRRRGDKLVMVGFAWLALVHLGAAIWR